MSYFVEQPTFASVAAYYIQYNMIENFIG